MSAHVSFDLSPAAACVDQAFTLVGGLDGRSLDHALAEVELLSRRVSALRSAVIGRSVAVERFKADGHRRAGGWVAALTGAGRQDAGVSARVASALSSMPRLKAAFDAGAVPFEVVEIITRRIHDDRVVERLVADDAMLTDFIVGRSADEVRRLMAGWDHLVDPRGAADAAVAAHRRRRVRIVRKDGEVRIYARFGAAQGEEVAAIHARFAQREFERDAAEAVDGELPRSADQRSADALAEALRTADDRFTHEEVPCPGCGAPVPAPTGAREPLTNLVFDEETFRRWVDDAGAVEVVDHARLRRFAMGTADGAPVPADDVVRSMILGQVRVIVRRADGVITSVGRRQRLFRGLVRDAVVLQHPTCVWPGCTVPASRCQADHLHPHAAGGGTVSSNGGPLCDHHNRFKAAHGFTIERDDQGPFHVRRPDGTPITGEPPPEQRAGPEVA